MEESGEDDFINESGEAVNENKERFDTDYSSEEDVICVEDKNKTAEKIQKGGR